MNRFVEEAELLGFFTASIEPTGGGHLAQDLIGRMRSILFKLDRGQQAAHTAKMALRALKSFSTTFTPDALKFGLDIDPERGLADSGDLATDLTDLFVAIGEAARHNETAVLIAIDELQNLNEIEFAALIMAVHRIAQRRLPLVVIGAGCRRFPVSPATRNPTPSGSSNFRSSAPYRGPMLARLSSIPLVNSASSSRPTPWTRWSRYEGLPILHSRVGVPGLESRRVVADFAKRGAIVSTTRDGKAGRELLSRSIHRLTDQEKLYLRAMASFGDAHCKSADVASTLGRSLNSIGPLRDGLIKKGMIYMPKHGEIAFTLPLFDEFMVRTIPNFAPAVIKRSMNPKSR